MSKFLRAGAEAIIAIVLTVGILGIAFGTLFGYDSLIELVGIYYLIWAAAILAIHLGFATMRRHLRLSLSIGLSVIIMIVHTVLFATGAIDVDINLIPVVMHDFGFALVALVALMLVHMVIFRPRKDAQGHSDSRDRQENQDRQDAQGYVSG